MKKRILVIDDDRLVADTLKLIFAANGFESESRYSAAEGLERARSFAPELLLCDISMPEESGLSLVEKLHREMPECRALLLTAYSSNAFQVHQSSQRIKRELRMLTKPCPPEHLLRETRELLG